METLKKTPKKTSKAPEVSSLGLDKIGNLSDLLGLSANQDAQANAGPIEILLHLIDEDPNQPRKANNPGFSAERIAQIGESIKKRNVKSPISVRENPDHPGRFIINHGARRYRGSVWAGKASIPAFIDNYYQDEDQVIENLERDDLTPREIADYIGRKLAEGLKKKEIAALLNRSPAFISQHVTLLDLPDSIADAFASGRVNDVTLINELVSAYKESPDALEDFLADNNQEVSRGAVKLLREFIQEKQDSDNSISRDPNTIDAFTGKADGESGDGETATEGSGGEQSAKKEKSKLEPDPNKFKKAIVLVIHNERQARIMLDKRPTAEGYGWLKYDDDGHEFETDLGDVRLNAIIEG